MKPSKSYGSLVKCPFCEQQVPSKKLADHAKTYHAGHNNYSSKLDPKSGAPLEKAESTKPIVPRAGDYFIDPSGFLVNAKLIQEEIKINGNDQPRGVTRGKRTSRGRFKKGKKTKSVARPSAPVPATESRQGLSMDAAFQEKIEWLNRLSSVIETATNQEASDFRQCPICNVAVKQNRLKKHIATVHRGVPVPGNQMEKPPIKKAAQADDMIAKSTALSRKRTQRSVRHSHNALDNQNGTKTSGFSTSVDKVVTNREANVVKCPLCKHRAAYKVLFTHLQVSHPEINPKIVMAKFNRVNSHNARGNLSRYQEELNDLVKDYERLKQGLDEHRDGGKYMGHMRREHGRFGSLPLYDDYSDESDAE
jgi:hypothetical protein